MSIQEVLLSLRQRAAERAARVLLPDSFDPRTLLAVSEMLREGIAQPWLIGDRETLQEAARKCGAQIDAANFFDWKHCDQARYVDAYHAKRAHKGITREEAAVLAAEPLNLAGLLLDEGSVDAVVAGSESSTAAVLRAALQTIALAPGVKTLSSYFLMVTAMRVMAYADCAVVPEPTPAQLCDIASSTAQNFSTIMNQEARVAFLSFSTKGSAEHESITRIREALEMFKSRCPNCIVDGELQADVALVPSVAQRKAAQSPIQGDANVLVFPNLHAGNIAYKLSERLGSAVALGPIIQGLSKPYCDLSRGCTAEDIVNTACIAVLMA